MTRDVWTGLGAAVLFGAAAPVAKLLLPSSGPFLTAGLLYVAAAAVMMPGLLRRRARPVAEAPLRRAELPFVLGTVVAGGIVGPVLLMAGLSRLEASTASLLLNLEVPCTIVLAVVLFGEHLSTREWLGAGSVVLGAAALCAPAHGSPGLTSGALGRGGLLVAGACAAWALDNNLASRLSLKDLRAVVAVKALPAGLFNVAVGVFRHEKFPSSAMLGAVFLTGALGYGASLLLNLRAVRALGAARQSILFSTAPFVGALLALVLLPEHAQVTLGIAAALMAMGVGLVATAHHGHAHLHAPLAHEHVHTHDAHHAHSHDAAPDEPHSHWHEHEPLEHAHPHASDAHHRHTH